MNLCIVNEDPPQCHVPRKAIKACPGRGPGSWALSPSLALRERPCRPFSPQDFCSPCEFVHCSHNTRILRAAVHIKLVIMVSWDLRSASDSTIVCGTIQGISTCWFLGVHVWSQANEGLYSILRMRPRLLWLSGLSASLQTKALPVWFHQATWLICRPGSQWEARKRQPHIDLSLPLSSLPSPLKINKIF